MDTTLLKKMLNWAKKQGDVTELEFSFTDFEEFPNIVLDANTKIEYSPDEVLIWEIPVEDEPPVPIFIVLDKLISVHIA